MPYPKVSVVGAGQVGATTAFLLLEKNLADVVLVDVADGLPQGKALDMMHSRSVERFAPRIVGTNDYGATAGSDIVVVTAGLPRQPGMSRDDLLARNSDIVRSVVSSAIDASPDAILLLVTNPLDVMTYLAWKLFGLAAHRVLGMGGVLDSARFAYAIAEETGAPIDSIEAVAVGAHGDAMVPLPRHSRVDGVPLTEMLDEERVAALCDRTVNGGAEVVALLKTGSAFYAPAASVARMVAAILGDTNETMSSCVRLDGEYGITDVYMSVPATLGSRGVVDVPEIPLTRSELEALRESADSVASALDSLGERA